MTGPATTVVIAALPDGALEALALRSVLEASGHDVHLRFIATPYHFRQLVAAQPVPDMLVICCHGADGGLYIGPVADSVGGHELVNGSLMPECFASHVALRGCTVLCTACDAASATLAQAFLQGGARAYLAPAGEPDGNDMLLAAHVVLHGLLRGVDPHQAVMTANAVAAGDLSLTLHQGASHAA